MLTAAIKALGDLFSPEFRAVLFKAVGLTIALFIGVLVLVEVLLVALTQFSWPWADWVLGIGTGIALIIGFFFLMSPVTAAFAGLFLDQVAEKVEARHYPLDPRGTSLPAGRAIVMAVQFFLVVLVVNLAVLPVVLFGVGAVALIAANAYLLSREYFEMVAMRHMPAEEAKILRRENGPSIFLAGLLPAALSLVPVVNLAVPLFATSFFTHLFKSARASSA
ncbi:sulfate transporter family protein [Aestuariivirga sp.]|uniref:sulfate transporter family protein n=1 Tax=Aestuariivirga sp. TaxID=2650926 RepID=UPI003919D995